MKEKLKPGDMVYIKGKEPKPYEYLVIGEEGLPTDVGGLTLVARWYRTDSLIKAEYQVSDVDSFALKVDYKKLAETALKKASKK